MIPIQFTLLLGVMLWLCAVVVLQLATPSLADHHAARLRYLDKLQAQHHTHYHRHRKKTKKRQHTVITLDEE